VNTVHSAELRYGNKKQIQILPDGNDQNLSLEKFLNLLNQQENNLNTSYTANLLENINDNNQFYLLVDLNSAKSSKNSSTDTISSNSIRCSPTGEEVNSHSSARFAGISFLAQSSNDNLFEDVYDSLTQKDCQVVVDKNMVVLSSLEENDIIAFKPLTLVDYTRANTQFTPVQTNYIYLQTAQELNNISNRNLQSFNYRNNTQSLGLVNSALIKPIVPRANTTKNNSTPNITNTATPNITNTATPNITNTATPNITNTANIINAGKNNPVVSNKPALPQATNTNFSSQPNLNYLNALSNSQITDFSSTTGISSYQNQVPSSPILDKMKKEREAQQKELEQRLNRQRQELQRQTEQRRREQERAEQNRRRQLEQQQRQRQQELVRQQQRQLQQSQSFR
jgi:hypothetical protein